MRRGFRLLAALALVCVSGRALAEDARIDLRVEFGAEEVALGEAFPITVVRTWPARWHARPWDDAALAPLTLEETRSERRETGGVIEETLVFRARAFVLGDVEIPFVSFAAGPVPHDDPGGPPGEEIDLRVPPLRVAPLLDPENPGEPELPGGLLRERFPWAPVVACALLLAVALVLVLRRVSRDREEPAPAPEPAPPPVDHAAIALERLRALSGRRPDSADSVAAFYVEGAAVLRDYVGGRCGLDLEHDTSEELLARDAILAAVAGRAEALAGLLRSCDFVKFGGVRPGEPGRGRWVEDATEFVRATRTGGTDA